MESGDVQPQGYLQTGLHRLTAALMIAITVVVLYATVMRYFFQAPPLWGEDVPRVLFVWMVYMAAGLAIALGLNIRVAYFIERVPDRPRAWIEAAMHLSVLALLVVLFFNSIPLVELNLRGTMLSTGWSNAVFYLPLPVGCLLMAWYEAKRLWRCVARLR